jgi:hypothetical protein
LHIRCVAVLLCPLGDAHLTNNGKVTSVRQLPEDP